MSRIRTGCIELVRRKYFEACNSRGLAGHSHYHNTRHRKAAIDAKRATLFHRLAREVYSALAQGGPDPSSNLRLARALENARRCNMPKARLDRALESAKLNLSGIGVEPADYDAVLPRGIGVRMRAIQLRPKAIAAELRSLVRRAGGDFGKVHHFFHERMAVVANVADDKLGELIILRAMENDVSDFNQCDDGAIEFACDSLKSRDILARFLKSSFPEHQNAFFTVRSLEPLHVVDVTDEEHERTLHRLFSALDDHPDVTEVVHNANI